MKFEYIAPEVNCRKVVFETCMANVSADMGEDGNIPTASADDGPVVDPATQTPTSADAWGDAKHIFDSLWD